MSCRPDSLYVSLGMADDVPAVKEKAMILGQRLQTLPGTHAQMPQSVKSSGQPGTLDLLAVLSACNREQPSASAFSTSAGELN